MSSVAVFGLALGCGFWWGRPFDSYLLHRWEGELSTLSEDELAGRLEQIAALGHRSFPTLVAALHSERQIVAENALLVLQRELGKLELRSTDETSGLVARVATELADHSNAPGPYSGPGSMWLATRILLWPIDRKLVDGERLVADCELVIRSARQSAGGIVLEQGDDEGDRVDHLASGANGRGPEALHPHVAGGGLPVQLTETPSPPPQDARVLDEKHFVAAVEPKSFAPVQAPSVIDARSIMSTSEDAAAQPTEQPPASAARQNPGVRRDAPSISRETPARTDLQSMSDFDVIQKLAGDDERLTREAADELYRRGFQTKHFRLAEGLIDPDAGVRLQFVKNLPQMSGIDSRPWLLWLSRDRDPSVRKAAIAALATSADPALRKHVSELEREETDEDVLQAVRQILSSRRANSIR
ncbi:MAG TPA: HEAT repeat domain-containing protein [Pirellulaceae bacterium]|nr:HEAT repeat domain-containing protein [Pirellulaceae bacterium]